MKTPLRPFGDLLALVGAFVLWSFAFVILYGAHGVACARGWASPDEPWPLRIILVGLWVAMTALSIAYAWWSWRRRSDEGVERFLRLTTLATAVVGAVSTAWLGLPLLLLRVCA